MTKRNGIVAAIAAVAIAVTGLATSVHAASIEVGVILPDAASSARWETADRPFLAAAFKAAGVSYDIQNANGDKTAFATIADQMLSNGAKVLLLVNLDSASATAVQDKAAKQGVKTIDYDRLTKGGSESYYVSFDNVAVGKLQGTGIYNCLKANKVAVPRIVYLNGSPTDNNATLFKQGYVSVLGKYVAAKKMVLVADQSVPNWDNVQGGTIFEQMLTKAGGKLDAVVSANEGLGLAAVAVLKKNHLNGKVCVSGQDASVDGLRAILTGDLSNTVYKAVKAEANAAASLAVSLIKGTPAKTNGFLDKVTGNPAAKATATTVPSVLLTPVGITKRNVKVVIADGFAAKADVCKGLEKLCTANGI